MGGGKEHELSKELDQLERLQRAESERSQQQYEEAALDLAVSKMDDKTLMKLAHMTLNLKPKKETVVQDNTLVTDRNTTKSTVPL